MKRTKASSLSAIAKDLGRVVGESRGDSARALHLEARDGALVLAACDFHPDVIVALRVSGSSSTALLAARLLVYARRRELFAGHVVTLPDDDGAARKIAGAPGAYALLQARDGGVDFDGLLAVGVGPPVDAWERATVEEVRAAVPDLITRFR